MQVTQQHIDWLTAMGVSEEIIAIASEELTLQTARLQSMQAIFSMQEFALEGIRKGEYDDVLGDIHKMIDRTQELMIAKQQENLQSNEEENV